MQNKMNKTNKAIILASGGLDSSVLAYWLKKTKEIKEIELIFFDYNQKCIIEEKFCIGDLAQKLNAKLTIIKLPWLGDISTSIINEERGELENDNKVKKSNNKANDTGAKATDTNMKNYDEISNWYVPCRNTIFLIIALAHAESEFIKTGKKSDIYVGIKYEGELQFNDTKPEFIAKINSLSKNATQFGDYEIKAPFLNKDKEEIIEMAKELGIDLKMTYSCYIGGVGFEQGKPIHCGKCAGCLARKKGFRFVNPPTPDTSLYHTKS